MVKLLKSAKIFCSVLFVLSLSSCVMSSGPVSTNVLSGEQRESRSVTFLQPTPYIAEMTIALAEHGFKLRPLKSQRRISQDVGDGRTETYNEASARWGLTLLQTDAGIVCAFTEHHWYNFTLLVTDLKSNEVVMVLKQRGPDGPCTTAEPVFGTIAAELARRW